MGKRVNLNSPEDARLKGMEYGKDFTVSQIGLHWDKGHNICKHGVIGVRGVGGQKMKGKLYERINESVHCETGFNKLYYETVIDLLDEAKAEISNCKNFYAMKDAFEKWFGTVEV